MRSGRKRVTQNRETKLLGYREKEINNIKREAPTLTKNKNHIAFYFLFLTFVAQNSILKQEIVYTLKTNRKLSKNRRSKRVRSVRIDFFILLEHLLQDYPL